MKVLAAALLAALAGSALGAPGAPPRRIVAEVCVLADGCQHKWFCCKSGNERYCSQHRVPGHHCDGPSQ
ncbi:hypothetical protein ACCO45_004792 [Purpureocillium lilacinum]|uniref:Uncharacterized protein n=1 Tax=Purpureocillium lilacinum TaxID=33203 RepID=A0ACC4DWG8_PURLI